MMNFSQQLRTLHTLGLIIMLAFLGACSSNSGNDSGEANGNTPRSLSNLSGSAVKGIFKNAKLSAYQITNGDKGELLVETKTDPVTGTYSLNISDYTGPVLLEVSALEASDPNFPSIMVCDLPQCSDTIGFNDEISLPENFFLQAVLPSLENQSSLTANITVLTDLSASYAASLPGGWNPTSIAAANSQIADLFDLTGNILTLSALDITDGAALSNASTEAQQAAFTAAAIFSAGLLDQGNTDFLTALLSIKQSLVDQSGQLIINDDNAAGISVLDIQTEILKLITLSENTETISLSTLKAEILAMQSQSSQAVIGSFTDAQPDPNLAEGTTDLAITKAMVSDLRDISVYFDNEGTPELFTTFDAQANNFAGELEIVEGVADTDLGLLGDAMEHIAEALGEAVDFYVESESLVNQTFDASNGIPVSISTSSDSSPLTTQFTIAAPILNEQVTANITAITTERVLISDRTDTTTAFQDSIELGFELSGMLEHDRAKLNIHQGSINYELGLESSELPSTTSTQSNNRFATKLDIDVDLQVKFEQKLIPGDITNPLTFEGVWQFSIIDFLIESNITSNTSDENSFSSVDSFSLDKSDYILSGTFADSQGNSIKASLALSLDGSLYEYVNHYNISFSPTDTSFQPDTFEVIDPLPEETNEQFISGSVVLTFEVSLAGIEETSQITFSLTRNFHDQIEAALELELLAKSFKATNLVTLDDNTSWRSNNTMTLINQSGVLADLQFNPETDAITGQLLMNNQTVAEVSNSNGLILIRYADGSIETLQ